MDLTLLSCPKSTWSKLPDVPTAIRQSFRSDSRVSASGPVSHRAQPLIGRQCPKVSLACTFPSPWMHRSLEGEEEPIPSESLYVLAAGRVFLFHPQENSPDATSCTDTTVYCKFRVQTVSFDSQESTDPFLLLCCFLLSLKKALLLETEDACFQISSLWILKQTLILIPEAQPWLGYPASIHPSPGAIKIPVSTGLKLQGNKQQLGINQEQEQVSLAFSKTRSMLRIAFCICPLFSTPLNVATLDSDHYKRVSHATSSRIAAMMSFLNSQL